MTSTATTQLTTHAAVTFARTITTGNSTFVTIGDPIHSTNVATTAVDSSFAVSSTFSNIVGGDKITTQDVAIVCKRIDWVSGTKYTSYNAYQYTDCFVTTQIAGGIYRVYKCLIAPGVSTVSPSGTQIGSFKTTDGYIWQFMWEIPAATAQKFVTTTTIPVVANANVAAGAISQSVDGLTIVDSGRGYINSFDSILQPNDLVSLTQYHLPASASNINQLYQNCVITITNPTSACYGQYHIVTDYNSTTKTITIDQPFIGIQVNDTYSIRPQILIQGSTTSNNAVASAIVDQNQTIVDTVIHKRGSDYVNCNVSVVTPLTASRTATIVGQPAPVKGHGSQPFVESNACSVMISKTFSNTSFVTSAISSFAQVAIVHNPTFDNVVVVGQSNNMTRFAVGESIVGYKRNGSSLGTVTTSNTQITGFTSPIATGDVISVANTTQQQFVTITQANTTVGTITNQYPIIGTGYNTSVVPLGKVKLANTTALVLTQVPASVNVAITSIAGLTSHTTDEIVTINYNQQPVSNITQLTGNISGQFTVGELAVSNTQQITVIGQTSNTIVGYANTTIQANTVLTGQQSSQTITVSNVVAPSLVKNSGSVMYINNTAPINIQNNRTISVVITITF